MSNLQLQLGDELEKYEQAINSIGVEFIHLIGEQLEKAKARVIEITDDKRAAGFREWAKDKFGFSPSTIARSIKAWREQLTDPNAIWGNKKKSVALTTPTFHKLSTSKLIVGDAEHLPLDDESIDVIVTSPPYNLGSENWPMGGDDEWGSREPRSAGIGYADQKPELEYQAWQVRCLSDWYRVAKNGASLFYNHKVRQTEGTMIHPMDWLRSPDNPWIIRQEIIWDRTSTHNHCAVLFWPHDERIYWMTKRRPFLKPDESIGESTIWRFHGPVAGTWHPAPFSEELPTRCLKAVGRPGITVLDPFGGSMTTCAVAEKMGYKSIGVDINPEYIAKIQAAQNG